MRTEIKEFFKNFTLELLLYGALVLGYFYLVLHFLGAWLEKLFTQERGVYAAVALGLIIGQGILLEALTTALLRLIRASRRR